jgi:hypothetical protein
MRSRNTVSTIAIVVLAIALAPGVCDAHCDGMDGPVVSAARRALQAGDVAPVLAWVQEGDESDVRTAFAKTMAVRDLGDQAKELAELYFFETIVRIHRAGEGAPYTGLKPAGRDLGPAIPAADRALAEGAVDPLIELLTAAVRRGVRERFEAAQARKKFDQDDVEAGRAYVRAYVPFVHYVERLYETASSSADGHRADSRHQHRSLSSDPQHLPSPVH